MALTLWLPDLLPLRVRDVKKSAILPIDAQNRAGGEPLSVAQ